MLAGTISTRRRNKVGTRDAILDAARLAFSRKGYDQVGVREITRAAGVNGSLVSRYFGSKQKLFAEAMQIGLGLDTLGQGTWETALGPLADFTLETIMERDCFDPILTLVRSAPIIAAQPILRDYLAREAVEPLARLIGGEDARERASLVVAFIIGVIILRTVVKSDPLSSTRRNDLASMVEQIIEAAARPTQARATG